MHTDYEDIRSRIPEDPKWFDERGVPRYGDFSVACLANIYWREAALAEIRCQACQAKFLVAFSFTPFVSGTTTSLEDRIKTGFLHYGDPPNVGCCTVGASMGSESVRVLEFWRRERMEPVRDESLEVHFVV